MFCNKCGTQLSDSAAFCNQCGNAMQATLPPGKKVVPKTPVRNTGMGQKKIPKVLWLLLPIIILIAAVLCAVSLKKPDIHGTWVDEQGLIAFTFAENGSLRVSGKNNILGADLFQFTEDKEGNLTLQAKGISGDTISLNMKYELSEDMLDITVLGQNFTLYRTDEEKMILEVLENPEEAQEVMAEAVEEVLDTFQSISLYGTWTDESGVISFTFQENGTIRIGGLADTLGADLFTFTEVDGDTLQLKADTGNKLLNLISLNLNYEISGDVLTVQIAGNTYRLIKQD
ncbi:MAG: zinc ribbon domain-containing protein [Lachnospiraceae bacterium]|nr:zinc ribbon domain-containing protein [Lachnospiraceae bacterium]